jgi:hypothetical protein
VSVTAGGAPYGTTGAYTYTMTCGAGSVSVVQNLNVMVDYPCTNACTHALGGGGGGAMDTLCLLALGGLLLRRRRDSWLASSALLCMI